MTMTTTSFSLSRSLLLVCFCCLVSISVSQVIPGVDNRPDAYDGACMQESNELLAVTAIRNELSRLHSEVAQIELMDFCTLQDNPNIAGDRYNCRLDFHEFGYAFKTACSQNGGTYKEQNLRVHCLGRGETGPAPAYSWEFVNFPICTGEDCNAADDDRLLTRSVLQTEAALQSHLNHALCKADPTGEFRGGNIQSFITDQEDQIEDVLEQVGSESENGDSNQDGSGEDSGSKAPSSAVAVASMGIFGLALLL
mmetsp:Transcript_124764/g.186375  ORF Transcript_124764/g.186375 Transcript_124764/m.186375 type:complete len:253 (-) Transcript_124764:163-921(-)